MVCTNGSQSDRPYLLSGDSYITSDEMMQAAHEYEATLNAGIGAASSRDRHRPRVNNPQLQEWLDKVLNDGKGFTPPKARHRDRFEDSQLGEWANP